MRRFAARAAGNLWPVRVEPAELTRGLRGIGRVVALTAWCFLVWTLLTWTGTVEVTLFGIGTSLLVAVALAPLGRVIALWRLLDPRVLAALCVLVGDSAIRIVGANLALSRRIWFAPRPPTGMIVVPTRERSDAGLAAVSLITSLIVDNQIVDVDRSRHELLYHCVEVPEGSPEDRYADVNGPVEHRLEPFERH